MSKMDEFIEMVGKIISESQKEEKEKWIPWRPYEGNKEIKNETANQ